MALAGGPASARWLAIAPTDPGVTDQPKIWFLVGLPGNLVALELVSGGAHATYCFRVAPRASFAGGVGDPAQVLAAVGDVSEALVDARFLREPMAIRRPSWRPSRSTSATGSPCGRCRAWPGPDSGLSPDWSTAIRCAGRRRSRT